MSVKVNELGKYLLILAFAILTIPYIFWLFSSPKIIENSTLFYIKNDSLFYSSDLNNIPNIFNARYNYFFLKKGYSAFHPNLDPFKEPSEIPIIKHRIVLDSNYNITKDQVDSTFANVNKILLSLNAGIQVEIDAIFEYNEELNFTMNSCEKNKTIKYFDSLNPALKNSNLIIFSKNVITLDSVSTREYDQDPAGRSIKNGENPIILIYEPSGVLNPLRIAHEILHRTTGNFIPHCYKCSYTSNNCQDSCKSCKINHLLEGEISSCNIFIYANDILNFEQILGLESTQNKIIWPSTAEEICCENIFKYSILEIFKLFDEIDVLNTLKNSQSLSIPFTTQNKNSSLSNNLLRDVARIFKKEVIDINKYTKAKTTEAIFFNIIPTKEYIENRFKHDQEILERNAKIVLDHFMINKKDEITLRKAELKEILQEYFCEQLQNNPNTFLTKKYLELFPNNQIVAIKYIKNEIPKYKYTRFSENKILLTNNVSLKFNKSDLIKYYDTTAIENIEYRLSFNLDTINLSTPIYIPQTTPIPCNNYKYYFKLRSIIGIGNISIISDQDIVAIKDGNYSYYFNYKPSIITIFYDTKQGIESIKIEIQSTNFARNSNCSFSYTDKIELRN